MDIDKMPKIDLHCHLDGSLALEMIRRHTDNNVTSEMLYVRENCKSLTQYLKKFNLPLKCLQDKDGLKDGAYTFLKEVAKENMLYVEVRFAPMLSVHDGLSCSEVIEAVLEGLKKGKDECGVQYNVITCAMRHHNLEQNLAMLHAAREYLGNGVCAIDLAGDESEFPTILFRKLFMDAKKLEMPFVIHSGETGSLENVRIAYELGASRIGHGIALIKDSNLMHAYAIKGIGVELCPSSNLQTKAVKSLAEYPLMDFINAGIKVSINTDNRTVSNTTMTKELKIIYNLYNQDDELIYQLLRNAAETAFEKDLKLFEGSSVHNEQRGDYERKKQKEFVKTEEFS